MNGDKVKKGGYELRSNLERELETEAEASETPKQDGGRRETETLDSIRTVVSEVMTTGMAALQAELKKDLSDFRTCFREDIKKQMDEFASEVSRKIQDVTGQIEGAVKRVGQIEESMLDMERWDIGVKDTLTQLLTKQRALQEKVTDLEGRSRRNNIRIYGIPEEAEGTSAVTFIENFIKTELGSKLGRGLGIERAHRAMAPKPPPSAPPRSMVVRFLQFSVKEKILHAAWKKELRAQNKRVYFDHDYATEVQNKRKEYIPIKKILRDNGVRFQTPLTRMHAFFETGPVTYNSAAQAAEDLRRRGYTVGEIPGRTKSKDISEETLARLLPWETTEARPGGEKHRFQEQIREKLKEYRRTEPGATTRDE